ncbi:MAG TPA: putative baseplate assembly protein [Polyangiales bacterium]|nr:putative baseplate assembly protein [Polyangiales bacterium]
MAAAPITADYTQRDYASILASLLDHATLRVPEWTDRSANDLGRLLLETTAYSADVILYYLDRLAAESFPNTASERRSVIDLLSLIGYTLATPAAAAADLQLTFPNDSNLPVTIQIGARFATKAAPGKPPIEFVFLPQAGVDTTIVRSGAGGQVTAQISARQATRVVAEIVGRSTGEANQTLVLKQTPVILPRDPESQEVLEVEVDPGTGLERWTKRATLLYSLSGDKHFITRVRDTDEVEIVFGDGTYGAVPPPNAEVRATYLIGGGSTGNVGPGTITEVKSGVSVTGTCTNPLAASGGADRETLENARRQAPLVFRSLQRAVTATDYAVLAQSVEGVARAVAIAPGWNYVDLYVVAAGIAAPSVDLQARLLTFFSSRKSVTTLLNVRAPVFVNVSCSLSVGIEPNFYQADVLRRVHDAIQALFTIERLEFGQTFYSSKLFEAAELVAGVAFVQLTLFQGARSTTGQVVASNNGVLALQAHEFPKLTSLVLTPQGGLA